MNLDARSIWSAAFMRARHADPSLPAALVVARALVVEVERRNRLDVARPSDLALFDPRELVDAPAPIALGDRTIFDVIRCALDDLVHLDGLAVRNLGYAFHRLPELREPFDRNLYAFSLRFVAFHWAVISADLKRALARLVDVTPEALEARVTAPGFASSMFTSP